MKIIILEIIQNSWSTEPSRRNKVKCKWRYCSTIKSNREVAEEIEWQRIYYKQGKDHVRGVIINGAEKLNTSTKTIESQVIRGYWYSCYGSIDVTVLLIMNWYEKLEISYFNHNAL